LNNITAQVTEIKNSDSLHIIKFDWLENTLCMISLELLSSLQIGSKVLLGVKPSSISLSVGLDANVSFSNRLNGTIKSIQKGELVCSVLVDIHGIALESIITLESLTRMSLKPNDNITVLFKASDLSIIEIESEKL
jgi:molybdopterin-binding protein